VGSSAYGWFENKSRRLQEDKYNRELREKLESHRLNLETREKYLEQMRATFESSYVSGRKWLARFIAEADREVDEQVAHHLQTKKHPAFKAAEEVAVARAERRLFKERCKFLEYELLSFKEYFPFLEEYEDVILNESVSLGTGQPNLASLEEADPVLRFLPQQEYEKLSAANRNQLALDRYLSGSLSQSEVGKLYERYLGYLHEVDGWAVEYHGILKGFEDLGRDLICKRHGTTKIIQTKCWASEKTIHEKHIFQLFGTTQLFLMDCAKSHSVVPEVIASFVTTTKLSPTARDAAHWLKMDVLEQFPLVKSFPMIKCNINAQTKSRIYHLPFDQQYDRTRIVPSAGELYAKTVAEAEAQGFRRAFRYMRPMVPG